MAYIGQRPVVGRYIKLDQISSGFNGSNTDFNMTAGSQAVFPGTARNLLLSLGGVIQEPDTDFTISGSTLTFTTPPVSNTTFFGVIYGDMQAIGTPSDGTVLPISIASSGNFTFPEITLTGDLTIPDKLIHSGDTDTNIRFPSNNTISAQTAGSEAIRITNGQKVLIGSTSLRNVGGSSTESVFQIEGISQNRSSISLINNQASASPASLRLGKTRGTSVGAVDAVTDGDQLGQIRFVGSDGTDLENTTAMIIGRVNGTVSSNTIPTDIAFETSATNGNSRAERMRIDSAGDIGIGTDNPLSKLHVRGSGTTNLRVDNSDDGTASLTLGNTGSSNLVIAQTSANAAFSIGGSEKMRIDSSGNVGIGTPSPSSDLHVSALGASDEPTIRIASENSTIFLRTAGSSGSFPTGGVGNDGELLYLGGDFRLGVGTASKNLIFFNGSGYTERMRIDSSGRVGIGTNSPDNLLHLTAGSCVAEIESTASGNSARLIIKSANDTYTGVHFGDDADDDVGRIRYYHNTDHMQFSVGTTERMRIDSSGNVGIGTTSPQTHLVLRAGNPQFTLEPTADTQTCRLQFCTTDGTIKTSIQGGGSLDTALRVVQNSAEKVRINTSGNISIGSTSNSGRLYIKGSGTGSGANALDVENSDNDELLRIRNDGGFFTGIDSGSPYNFTTSSSANVHIQSSGRMRRVSSSRKYKKDIADASWGLAEVLKLRPVTFKSNGTGENADDHTYGGFIAEEVHDSGLTDFVEYKEIDGSKEPEGVHYANMVALMTKAIQELSAKVAALEAA